MEQQPQKLARREFLMTTGALLAGTAASGLLAACGQAPASAPTSAPATGPTTAPAPKPTAAAGGAAPAAPATGPTPAPAVGRKVNIKWIEWITPQNSEEEMQRVPNAFYATHHGKRNAI